MSGPVSELDAPDSGTAAAGAPAPLEVTEDREAQVGRLVVRRALPRRTRRTVGAWCFVDHMGPADVTPGGGIDIGPHPHTGLQTVTWLVRGEALHLDSLGSEQPIRPGQLNLMTAGTGVVHAEEATGYAGELHGVQLWVAQPEGTRSGAAAFEHHAALPQVDLGAATATLLVGALAGHEAQASPARRDTDHHGTDLALRPGTTVVPLRAAHEHALVVLSGTVLVGGEPLGPGRLGYLGPGRDELPLEVAEPARALLLGGAPFPEQLLMYWNFVVRTREEAEAAYAAWTGDEDAAAERFGPVASRLPRIPAPRPPWHR